jgi:hypothetical protein
VANGHVYPEMADPAVGGTWAQPPRLLERRDGRFVPATCGDAWCDTPRHGRAAAFGDLDGDGDVDVLMTTLNGPVLALRNEARGPWLSVLLRGAPANGHAYGATVELTSETGVQRRWLTGGGSYQSVDAPVAYFGGGGEADPVRVRVAWPHGGATRIAGAPAGRTLVVQSR